MDYLTWDTSAAGNVCRLEGLENVERDLDLLDGVPFGDAFPADARIGMSKKHKKNTALADDIPNDTALKYCSQRLVDFLRAKKLSNVEYLPVTVLDHKGKPTRDRHFIVHLVHPQDALDLERSRPRFNALRKTKVDAVGKLVLDPRKVDPEVRIFRLAHYRRPVIIEKKLALEMEAQGFTGPAFYPLDEWES
jgi:hypothetical protein